MATAVQIALTWAVDPRDMNIKAMRLRRMEKGGGCREDHTVRVCGSGRGPCRRWRGAGARRWRTVTATVTCFQHLVASYYLRSQETGLGQRLSSADWLQPDYK